jgi:hypothetical protein
MKHISLTAIIALAGACSVTGSLLGKGSTSSPSTSSSASSADQPLASQASQTEAPSAAASSDDDAPWRPTARKINEDCTIGGTVSKICVDLYIKVADGRADKGPVASDGERAALDCILGAAGYLASSAEYRKELKYDQTSNGTDLIASGDVATPYGKECIRATNLAVGNDDWQKRGNELKTRAAWADKMRETVKKTFRKKCGVEATLDGDTFGHLTIERVTSNSKVFYEGKDGDGTHVRVTCGGRITKRYASGGTMEESATPWDAKQMSQSEQCVESCRFTAGRPKTCDADTSSRLCHDDCERRCIEHPASPTGF